MNSKTSDKHKFLEDTGMTFQEVFDFAYKGSISLMQNLANELGEDHFIEIIKKAASESALREGQNKAKSLPSNDFPAFKVCEIGHNHFMEHALTLDAVEDTERALEIKVTECLWAKTFRESDASDIGYAALCHSDFAFCKAFNSKIRMIRSKTLMQGDSYCNHRWIWEE